MLYVNKPQMICYHIVDYTIHVISCLHYMNLTIKMDVGGWWWSYRREGCQAINRVSRLQINICKCETLAYFEGDLWMISSWVCCSNKIIFLMRSQAFSSCVLCVTLTLTHNRYFKHKHDLFLTLTKWFLCLTRPEAQCYHNITLIT